MAQNSFALMTNLGRSKEAAAIANGTAIVITHIAIGDGTTVPSGGETALYHEIARKSVSGHGTVTGAANVAYFDIFLEAAEGPYTIREAGLIDQDGDLIAIARYDPPINKPIPSSGQTVEGTVRLEVAFSNIANVTIVVDPSFKVQMQRLSRLPWVSVISMSVTAPPATPSVGDLYLVPSGSTGAWAGQSGKVAEFTAAGWGVITPPEGHGVSLPDGRVFQKVGGVYIEKLALDVQSGKWRYAAAGGTATAITLTLAPVPQAYADGLVIRFKAAFTCQGASTINVNGLGAVAIVRQGYGSLERLDWLAGDVIEAVYVSGVFQLLNPAQMQFLTSAQGSVTIYVRTDGNDANDGSANTAAKAFATIDAAASYALRRFNTVTQTTIIQLGNPGSYDGCNISGIANLRLRGDPANPSAYVVGGTKFNAIRLDYCPGFRVEGIKIRNGITVSASSNGLLLGPGSNGYLVNSELDAVVYHSGYAHISIGDGAQLSWAGTIKFLRSAPIAIDVSMGGIFSGASFADPATVQMGAALNQETFIRVIGGRANVLATTFVGTNGGKRYDVSMNGAINTAGAGANFFPGDQAGVSATGGVYA